MLASKNFFVKEKLVIAILSAASALCHAQTEHGKDTVYNKTQELKEVTVTSKTTTKRMIGAVNGMQISQQEMFRAACCNLGESFTTNPSVDVSYSDAATGAKQIKLLGLAGIYVQMLTETMPAFRGSAQPFALGYVPGTWMKSISVSKGAASVKNGYESITGQIDIEYLKPDDEEKLNINLYGDLMKRFEVNADRNFHLSNKLSTNILAHYEKRSGFHDGNGDGYQDSPNIEQINIANRWKLNNGKYLMHAGWSMISEKRKSGTDYSPDVNIDIDTKRYEGYMKHAFIINPEKQTNIAFLANAALQQQDAMYYIYEASRYGVNEKNLNAQLMYETNITDNHSLSTGLSLNHDYLKQDIVKRHWENVNSLPMRGIVQNGLVDKETTYGAYAQYTYNLGTAITAMAGIRWDHSSLYGNFVTPRAHVKFQPFDELSIRISAGKGYRTVHPYAENHNLMASGRLLFCTEELKQEEAWNYGISARLNIPVADKTLKLNAEYYFTDFINQAVIDYEMEMNDIQIHNLDGESFSHVFQIDATYPLFKGVEVTAAYRKNIVKCTYAGELKTKPLTPDYKALLSIGWKDRLDLWQIDVTLQMNGGGRLPYPYPAFKPYEQLTAQVTRRFRHFDIYIGGENLTNYKQDCPIINAQLGPSAYQFEPTLVYGPIEGAMAYAGIRVKI